MLNYNFTVLLKNIKKINNITTLFKVISYVATLLPIQKHIPSLISSKLYVLDECIVVVLSTQGGYIEIEIQPQKCFWWS